MEITLINNSTFLIKTSLGKKILLDPLQIETHIKKYDINADIITFSHFHNNDILNKFSFSNCKIINSVCSFSNDYIKIDGFKTYRDNFSGFKRGENIIYLLEVDGLRICHLGSLGHILDESLIKKLYNLDFLFIPIGGNFYLDGLTASKLANKLEPKFIIPIYFKNSTNFFYLDGAFKFLSSMKNILNIHGNTISSTDLPNNNFSSVLFIN